MAHNSARVGAAAIISESLAAIHWPAYWRRTESGRLCKKLRVGSTDCKNAACSGVGDHGRTFLREGDIMTRSYSLLAFYGGSDRSAMRMDFCSVGANAQQRGKNQHVYVLAHTSLPCITGAGSLAYRAKLLDTSGTSSQLFWAAPVWRLGSSPGHPCSLWVAGTAGRQILGFRGTLLLHRIQNI